MNEHHTPETIDKLVRRYANWAAYCALNPQSDPAEMIDASNNLDAAIIEICKERDEALVECAELRRRLDAACHALRIAETNARIVAKYEARQSAIAPDHESDAHPQANGGARE